MARLLTGCAGVVLLLGLTALPASAHVTVHAQQATQDGYAKLTFRVPTEMDNASTTKLQVFFPTDSPIASVSVQPHPGWNFKVTTTKLSTPVNTGHGTITEAVSKITWTADSADTAIKPGEFDEFAISAGPLPSVPSLTFKALQTYSNGTIVRWIQLTQPGEPAPEHPAPVLTLASNGSGHAGDPASVPSGSTGVSGLALAALIVAVVALLAAAAGWWQVWRVRRTPAGHPDSYDEG